MVQASDSAGCMYSERFRKALIACAEKTGAPQELLESAGTLNLIANKLGQVIEVPGGFVSYLRCDFERLQLLRRGDWQAALAVPLEQWGVGAVAFVLDAFSSQRGAIMPACVAIATMPGVSHVAFTTARDGVFRIVDSGQGARVAAAIPTLRALIDGTEAASWAA